MAGLREEVGKNSYSPWTGDRIDPAPEGEDHLNPGIAPFICLPWDEVEIFQFPQISSGLSSIFPPSHEAGVAYVLLVPISRWALWLREVRSLHRDRDSSHPVGRCIPSSSTVPGTGQPRRYTEKKGMKECNLSEAHCSQSSRFETWIQLYVTPLYPFFTLAYLRPQWAEFCFVLFFHFYYCKKHMA